MNASLSAPARPLSRAQIQLREDQWRGRFAAAIAADCTHQEAVLYANALHTPLQPMPGPRCDVLVKGFAHTGQCLNAERFQPEFAGCVVRLLVGIAFPS